MRLNRNGPLTFPDYSGNRFFNTLRNIEVSGRAGLLISEFISGETIVLTGGARIDWSDKRAAEFDGAERIVEIKPDQIWHVRDALPRGSYTGV